MILHYPRFNLEGWLEKTEIVLLLQSWLAVSAITIKPCLTQLLVQMYMHYVIMVIQQSLSISWSVVSHETHRKKWKFQSFISNISFNVMLQLKWSVNTSEHVSGKCEHWTERDYIYHSEYLQIYVPHKRIHNYKVWNCNINQNCLSKQKSLIITILFFPNKCFFSVCIDNDWFPLECLIPSVIQRGIPAVWSEGYLFLWITKVKGMCAVSQNCSSHVRNPQWAFGFILFPLQTNLRLW